jgi:hypothetical protein
VTYNKYAWIGLGVSIDGSMIGSVAAIGIQDPSKVNVNKYSLNSKTIQGVSKAESQDSIYGKSFVQTQGLTTMEFETYLDWNFDYLPFLSSGETQMIFAYGYGNSFGYHKRKGEFLLNLGLCIDDNYYYSECSESDDPDFDQMKVFESGDETFKVYSKLI